MVQRVSLWGFKAYRQDYGRADNASIENSFHLASCNRKWVTHLNATTGGSVMFLLHVIQVLLGLGRAITRFCFCAYGSGFQKASRS